MQRKKCLCLISLSLVLAVILGLTSLGWATAAPAAPGDRLTVSGAFMNPQKKLIKEVAIEGLVNGQAVKPIGKEGEISSGSQGAFSVQFQLPAGTFPHAKAEVTAKKPNWEPLKPTLVNVVDSGSDVQGNRQFQAAQTFTLKRALTLAKGKSKIGAALWGYDLAAAGVGACTAVAGAFSST